MPTLIPPLSRSSILALLLCGCAMPSATGDPDAPLAGATLAGSRPNIIFIFSDDHAPHAIGAYGSRINQTPNIDRLAQEGVIFRNCFCGNAICGPSRATILTGKHTHANGFMRNGNRFDPDQVTFPKLLQKAGYQTALVGKWHLQSNPQGFDHWRILPGQGQYYNPDFIGPDGRERVAGYCTELTTQMALRWVRETRDRNKPFVLMCQHKAPHRSWMPGPNELDMYSGEKIPEPATLFDDWAGHGAANRQQQMEIDRHMSMFYDLKLLPTEEEQKSLRPPDGAWKRLRKRMSKEQIARWDAAFEVENAAFRRADLKGRELVSWKYQRYIKNYLRCVAGVDKSVGQVIDYVESSPELRDNTIIVYCSDQGFYLGDRGWYDKRWMYDESMRMPFLVRWPGKIKAGSDVSQLIQNIDFAPTFLDLAGVAAPGDLHGTSIVPLLEGKRPADWRRGLYYHYYESHATHGVAAHYGIRTEKYKLIRFYEPEHRYWELFDLEKDPDERTNVWGDPAYTAIGSSLVERLAALRTKYADDTGVLGEFAITAGLATVLSTERGMRVRSNARGSIAMNRPERALRGKTILRCKLRPSGDDRPLGAASNGEIVVTCGQERRRLFRGGIDFKSKSLTLGVPGRRQKRRVAIEIQEGAFVDLRLTFDLKSHTIEVAAAGKTLRAKLPRDWQSISAFGYGLSNAETEFTAIEVDDSGE